MSKSSPDPFLGKRIREYEILETLGKGGMGAVYKARHVYLDEERAIKVIQSRLAADKDFVDRFIREAKILTKLRHPNLVQLHEFGTLENDIFFMVLELLRGESVIDRIRRIKRIPFKDTIRIIREAALGLHSAHQKGIVHRDISPDNLVLIRDESGAEITKIIDFGIAKPNFDSTHAVTVANMFMGKPEYCSPEQCGVLEEGEVIDRRSDIYSLGVTFYQMVTGKLPFYSSTAQGYLLKHASEVPRPVSNHFEPGELPAHFDRIIGKMMAKKRDERYSTMEELVKDLDALGTPEEPALSETAWVEKTTVNLETGDLFARRYMIEKKLGEGGMGIVYKAIDKILDVPVALKVVSSKAIGDERTLERFKREVILARKVAHPNACRIYDMGENAGIHYVSMELLKGKTLAEVLRESGRLTADVGLPIMRQVLEALQEAHRVGVVHRDLKPQNIMVDLDLHACIMDFGISISKDATRVTQTGILIGTPFYMAPEQFEGRNVDHRTDIYSIGVIMYEIFTGKLPFSATSPMQVIFAHLKSTPPKPSELVENFPKDLEQVILKALEKEPDNRYQNVKEFLRAIDPLIAPTSSSVGFSKEALAHKLLAERSYSKAIQVLNVLLKNSPENEALRKLMNIAVSEKVKKDLRRAKSLIRKENLVQAQLIMQKIQQRHTKNPKVVSQIRKLESMLNKRRQQSMDQLLADAEKFLAERNYDAGIEPLENASRLNANDPKVQILEEKFQILKHDLAVESARSELGRAREALDAGKDDDALKIADSMAKKFPELTMVRDFHQDLISQRKIKQEDQRIRSEMQQILTALGSRHYSAASQELKIVQNDVTHPPFKSQLQFIQDTVQKIQKAGTTSKYATIPAVVEELLSKDEHGWIGPNAKSLRDLAEWASVTDRKIKGFQKAFNEGQALFAENQWEKAIGLFRSAQELFPEKAVPVDQWIQAAQQRLETENQMRSQVTIQLKDCERLIEERKLEAAQTMLESIHRAVSDYRLVDINPRMAEMKARVESEIKTRNSLRDRDMQAAIKARENGDLQEALKSVNAVLQREPGLAEAVRLREEIAQAEKERVAAIRAKMEQSLAEAASLLAQKSYDQALAVLASARSSTGNEPALTDLLSRVDEQEARIKSEEVDEQARRKRIAKDLQQAQNLYKKKELELAIDKLRSILNVDKSHNEASSLLEVIEAELDQKKREDQRFREAFDQGKKHYEDRQWTEALASWNRAIAIRPQDTSAKEWIAAAEERRDRQNELREQLAERFKNCEKLYRDGDYSAAADAIANSQKLFSSELDLRDYETQFKDLESKVRKAEQDRADRAARIKKNLTAAHAAIETEKLQEAEESAAAVLRDDAGNETAKSILSRVEALRKEHAAKHSAALEEGKKQREANRWEEAVAKWKEALAILPGDAETRRLLSDLEKRIETEKQLRADVSQRLTQASDQIARKRFDDARKLLDNAGKKVGDSRRLKDLNNRILSMQKTLEEEAAKEAERSETIGRDLAEISQMIQEHAHQQSARKIDELLNREPDLKHDEAFASEIRTVLQARSLIQHLAEQIESMMDLLVKQRYEQVSTAQQLIETTARGSTFEEEMAAVSANVTGFLDGMRSLDFPSARRNIDALTRYIAMRPYKQQLDTLRRHVDEREAREREFAAIFQSGVTSYQQKNWKEALGYFERLEAMNAGHEQLQSYLHATREMMGRQQESLKILNDGESQMQEFMRNVRWDDAVQLGRKILQNDYSSFPLQRQVARIEELISQSANSAKQEALGSASKFLAAGDLTNAGSSYRRVLSLDPDNVAARQGLEQVQHLEKQKKSPIPVALAIAVPAILLIAVLLVWFTGSDDREQTDVPKRADPTDQLQPMLSEARKLRQAGELEKALGVYESILKISPGSAEAAEEMNQVKQQLQQKTLVLNSQKEVEQALMAAGAEFKAGNYATSRNQANAILEKEPDNAAAKKIIDDLNSKSKELTSACESQMKRGNWDAASASCKKAMEADPENQQAIAFLTSIEKRMQSDRRVAGLLSSCQTQLQRGQLTEARNSCEEALRLDRTNSQARALLKQIDDREKGEKRIASLLDTCSRELSRNRCDAARQACNQVLALDRNNSQAAKLLAQIDATCQTVAYGEISINSEPWGTVYIDGVEKGPTPVPRFRIRSGPHTITVKRPGYKDVTEKVNVQPGEKLDRYYTLQKLS